MLDYAGGGSPASVCISKSQTGAVDPEQPFDLRCHKGQLSELERPLANSP